MASLDASVNMSLDNNNHVEFILFSSSSAAADFILGYGASGPHTWKTKNGRLLRELGQ